MRSKTLLLILLMPAFAGGCDGGSRPRGRVVTEDRPDRPLVGATASERARFGEGDQLFEVTYREPDGLGPLFVRSTCAACHRDDARGPGLVTKMANVTAAAERGTAAPKRSLPYGDTQRPYVTAGARTPLLLPEGAAAAVRVTHRLPPAVFGRGYLEAVADEEIERLARAAAARADGIRGRIHRVAYSAALNPEPRFHAHQPGHRGLVGRFGLKARIATLDEFTADAFLGDMGLTSPLRPRELPNPDELEDDQRPGVDLDVATVNVVSDYVRLLEIPQRKNDSVAGRALFAAAKCAACHVPSLRTRDDYPIQALAGIDAPVYTDFLLHDMGDGLADGVTDGEAGPREWRSAPLIGLRFASGLLHDGRAKSVKEAIAAHAGEGSEANTSVALFRALPDDQKTTLLRFVEGL